MAHGITRGAEAGDIVECLNGHAVLRVREPIKLGEIGWEKKLEAVRADTSFKIGGFYPRCGACGVALSDGFVLRSGIV